VGRQCGARSVGRAGSLAALGSTAGFAAAAAALAAALAALMAPEGRGERTTVGSARQLSSAPLQLCSTLPLRRGSGRAPAASRPHLGRISIWAAQTAAARPLARMAVRVAINHPFNMDLGWLAENRDDGKQAC